MGAGEAVGTAGAAASFKVAAIFALRPVVGAIVAVDALGGMKSGHSCYDRGLPMSHRLSHLWSLSVCHFLSLRERPGTIH